jgi:flagellar assembly factor FliW
MNLNTKYHGRIEINSDEILKFEKGIPGFMEEKEFILLPLSGDGTFFVMQSTTTSELAFVLSSPFNFFKDYDFKLDDSVVKDLGLDKEKDVLVYTILTVQDPFNKTTANLQAPVIINSKNRKAKQVILHNEEFKTKHPVFKKQN